MLIDLTSKTFEIKYRVILEEYMESILSLINEFKNDLIKKYPKDLVEILYEIRVHDEYYSGPSLDEFKKQ
jgi:hypothetical protein